MSAKWPDGWRYSMAPWGYVVDVNRTEMTETGVAYKCSHCVFSASFDPRDMTPESAQLLFRQHVDQSH